MCSETNIYKVSLLTFTLRTARVLLTGTRVAPVHITKGSPLWWHGCAATYSGTEQVQDIYTVFELIYVMYKNKVGITQCTET
jgi:hypothetical protein